MLAILWQIMIHPMRKKTEGFEQHFVVKRQGRSENEKIKSQFNLGIIKQE
jgi:hypothetical protein